MTRMTQYIGLSAEAKEFLKIHNAEKVIQFAGNEGMFGEEIKYSIYKATFKVPCYDEEIEEEKYYCEITEKEIWESGPMIYTCLYDLTDPERRLFNWF